MPDVTVAQLKAHADERLAAFEQRLEDIVEKPDSRVRSMRSVATFASA